MSADLVTQFLAALEGADPDAGYMVLDREPDAQTVGISGWVRRAELERILRGIHDTGRESAAHDLEAEASEVEKQFPGGRTSAVLVHAARLVREGGR